MAYHISSMTMQHNYKTYIIESCEQFNKVYPELFSLSIVNNNSIQKIHHIGLDCEYISLDTFTKKIGNHDWIKKKDKIIVCKLQMACDKLVIVLDLCKIGRELPNELINILVSANWIKTGIDVTNDLIYLSKNYELDHFGGVIDIKQVAQICGCENPNLERVYSKLYCTDYKKHREYTNVDWSNEMTLEMVKYCAEDAYISFKIGSKIINNIVNCFTNVLCNEKQSIILKPEIVIDNIIPNWIGRLQEYAQQNNQNIPTYIEQPMENDLFVVKCVSCDGKEFIGRDKTKKGAKQKAAKELYTDTTTKN